jgi:hypothetical protein
MSWETTITSVCCYSRNSIYSPIAYHQFLFRAMTTTTTSVTLFHAGRGYPEDGDGLWFSWDDRCLIYIGLSVCDIKNGAKLLSRGDISHYRPPFRARFV